MSEAAPNKRGRRGSGQGGNRDGPSKRQEHDSTMNLPIHNHVSVNQQILEALQAQNNLLQTQNTLLQSIDRRLGRIERQDQGNSRMQGRGRAQLPIQSVQEGTWKFAESPETVRQRELYQKEVKTLSNWSDNRSLESYGSFGKVDSEGLVLLNESYPLRGYFSMSSNFHQCQDISPPPWSGNNTVRRLLPHLLFNNKGELNLKSGVYLLTIKFSSCKKNDPSNEAGIIIGEMEFNNRGYAMAQGADWERLLNNQRQTQLPYANGARGVATWIRRKICEPWEDDDVLKFTIDTNENTVVFQRGNTPKRVFWNVLAFTNNRVYPEFLHVHAYCGGRAGQKPNPPDTMKLTIIN